MDGWPKVALVATPDVGATVLYDFNTTLKAYAGHDGLDTGHPEWRGEPGSQGGTDDYRSIRFTHYVDGTDAAATAAMATLSRLLMANYGWLLIQIRSGAAPRWAKVWRSSPGALSWDGIRLDAGVVKGKYGIDVTLTADPFLVGEKITLANAVTLNNDPAAGSNQHRIALSTAVGDAPAPAVVSVTPNTRQDGALRLFAIAPGSAVPTFWQVGTSDGWSVVNFAAATADAGWSGGSYRATTAATASLTGSQTVQPGRYLVLVRAGQTSGGTGSWTFAFRSAGLKMRIVSDPVVVMPGASDEAQWHPIGVTTFPQASYLSDAALAAEPTITTSVNLEVNRVSGSGNLNVDTICLIPVTAAFQMLKWAVFTTGTDTTTTADTVDSEQELVYSRNPADSKLMSRPAVAIGGFPLVSPGANVLLLFGAVPGAAADGAAITAEVTDRTDLITTTHTVTVTYRPRWLWPAS